MKRYLHTIGVALLMLLGSGAIHAADGVVALSELAKPGRVLIIRHALAPGFGDPDDFRLGDCSTQRNLDARGRAQAKQLGKRLAGAGIRQAVVYSSQWCRCHETAELLALGRVQALPALNSTFRRPELRATRIAALRDFLAALPADGPPLILVTHQVTIGALLGGATPSGGGRLLQLNGSASPHQLGEIEPN